MCWSVWSLQTDVEYVNSVVADLEKEWVHLFMETLPGWLCFLHVDTTNILFVQVFYRAEFRLTGGDLSTSCLLPWLQHSQGDVWRFQRKGQVRMWPVCVINPCSLEFRHSLSVQSNTNHRGYLEENNRDIIEMHESYTQSCRWIIQRWVRGTVGGSKPELLGKLLHYFVFHRHFSKSDQGQQQQQLPRSLLSLVLLPLIICSFYSARSTVLRLKSALIY